MPTTRSKSLSAQNALKPVSKAEWTAVEALLFMKKGQPQQQSQSQRPQRPQRSCATYTPGTFAGMED